MKNEELVRLIQQGHSEYMEQLWQQNKGFIRREAIRYAGVDTKREVEDLEQEGAIGLMRATETFDLSSGFSFLTYAGYWIKQSMRRYLTGGKRREDVIADATSLDIQTAPDNDTTVLETLEDENNISPEKSAVDNVTLQLVKRKIGSLPDIQRRILTGVCMYGRSIRSMSVDLGLDEQKTKSLLKKAKQTLAHDNAIMSLREITPRHKSLVAFKNDWSSVVEDTVINLIAKTEREKLRRAKNA